MSGLSPSAPLEGKYEVLGKIREGGMGAIYMVRHRLLNEPRVIKVMRPDVAQSEEQRKRFLREAQTATRLKHTNIVSFYDFLADDDGTAYIVMEYIEGINLRDMLKSCGALPPTLALYLGRQCLSALDYLHRREIVHRDIAPDNIMMTQEEDSTIQAKLIDLGIAKPAEAKEELTATGEFIGKLRYSSPEQLTQNASSRHIDGRSDLFSLGVVLYEVLTGVPPYGGGSLHEILFNRLNKPPLPFEISDPHHFVPEPARAIVLKALLTNPEERWQSAAEFGGALEGIPATERLPGESTHLQDYVLKALDAARRASESMPGSGVQRTLQSKFRLADLSWRPAPAAAALAVEALSATDKTVVTPPPGTLGTMPVLPGEEKTRLSLGRQALAESAATAAVPARRGLPRSAVASLIVAAAVLVAIGFWAARQGSPGIPAEARRSEGLAGLVPTPAADSREPTVASAALETPAPPPTAAPVEAAQTEPERESPQGAPAQVQRPLIKIPSSDKSGPANPIPSPRAVRPPADPSVKAPALQPARARMRFCAEIGRTQFEQGATQEVPEGFADTAKKPARPDAARLKIQISVQPDEFSDGEPFTVVASFVNGGDEDFRMLRAEESSPGVRGGFQAIEGLSARTVDIGGKVEIYRTPRTLAAGSTFQKSFRVVDQRRNDAWENTVTVRPCVESSTE